MGLRYKPAKRANQPTARMMNYPGNVLIMIWLALGPLRITATGTFGRSGRVVVQGSIPFSRLAAAMRRLT